MFTALVKKVTSVMSYRGLENNDCVDVTAPCTQTMEKLEERRLLLSLLTVICVVFCISQLFADYQDVFSVRVLCNWVVNFCLSMM